MSKQNLLNFSFDELKTFCLNNDLPRFRATQIWRWIYCFGLQSFMEMNNISKSTRVFLNELSIISRPQISEIKDNSFKKTLVDFEILFISIND